MPIVFGRVGDERLSAMADGARSLPFSYDQAAWPTGSCPEGYRRVRSSTPLGTGSATFERAVAGLRGWRAHRGAGIRVQPDEPAIAIDTSVAVALRLVAATAVAPCRIVSVVEETDRFGFTYGTLVGHPVSGQESFVVSRRGDHVTFDIEACSRPAHPLVRLGSPVAGLLQRSASRRYGAALRRFVGAGETG